jgi:hypothetical protein
MVQARGRVKKDNLRDDESKEKVRPNALSSILFGMFSAAA